MIKDLNDLVDRGDLKKRQDLRAVVKKVYNLADNLRNSGGNVELIASGKRKGSPRGRAKR